MVESSSQVAHERKTFEECQRLDKVLLPAKLMHTEMEMSLIIEAGADFDMCCEDGLMNKAQFVHFNKLII